jgi:hypothetical protein
MLGSTSWLVPGTWLTNARLVQGLVDYQELFVTSWDAGTRLILEQELPGLMSLDLQYSVHLPYPDPAQAWDAMQFFESNAFPVLSYVLHPVPGWRAFHWNNRVALENLKDVIEPYPRTVFDVGHHLLGQRVPDTYRASTVEVHAMGVHGGNDHLPLDGEAVKVILPWVTDATLITFEVFDYDALLTSLRVWEGRHAG